MRRNECKLHGVNAVRQSVPHIWLFGVKSDCKHL